MRSSSSARLGSSAATELNIPPFLVFLPDGRTRSAPTLHAAHGWIPEGATCTVRFMPARRDRAYTKLDGVVT